MLFTLVSLATCLSFQRPEFDLSSYQDEYQPTMYYTEEPQYYEQDHYYEEPVVEEYSESPFLEFLERIDFQGFEGEFLPSIENAQYVGPAQYYQDEQSYDGEGGWELQGYQIIDLPYFQFDGEYYTPEEMDEKLFDMMDNRVVSYQASLWSKIKSGLSKVAKVALPIMKWIPGPVGLAARAVDMGMKAYNVVKGIKNGGLKGGLSAAAGMVPGGKAIKGASTAVKAVRTIQKGVQTAQKINNGVQKAQNVRAQVRGRR